MKQSLRTRAFRSMLHSRFVAYEETIGHELTDDDVRSEAEYLLETIPYSGAFEGKELTKARRQLRSLLK